MQIKYETIGIEELKGKVETIRLEVEDMKNKSINVYEPISKEIAPRSVKIINDIVHNEINNYCNVVHLKVNSYKQMLHDLKETAIEVDGSIIKK